MCIKALFGKFILLIVIVYGFSLNEVFPRKEKVYNGINKTNVLRR